MVQIKLNNSVAALGTLCAGIATVGYLTYLAYKNEKKRKEEEDRFLKEKEDRIKAADIEHSIDRIVYGAGKNKPVFDDPEKAAFVYRYLKDLKFNILHAEDSKELDRAIERFEELVGRLTAGDDSRDIAYEIIKKEVEEIKELEEWCEKERMMNDQRRFDKEILDKKLNAAIKIAGDVLTNKVADSVKSSIEIIK